jgi:hypothetical protein
VPTEKCPVSFCETGQSGVRLGGSASSQSFGVQRKKWSYSVQITKHERLKDAWRFGRTKGQIVKGFTGNEESSCARRRLS